MRGDLARGRIIGAGVLLLGLLLTGCAEQPKVVAPPKPVTALATETVVPETQTFFAEAHDFSEGFAWVKREASQDSSTAVWECIDTKGKVAFSLQDGESPLTDFCRGSAIVGYPNGDTEKLACKLVGATGQTLFPKAGDSTVYYLETSLRGYSFVTMTIDRPSHFENRMGIIDGTGAWKLEPIVVEARDSLSVSTNDPIYNRYGLLVVRDYKDYDFFDAEKGTFISFPAPDNDDNHVFEKQTINYLYDRLFAHGLVYAAAYGSTVNAEGFELDLIGFKREPSLDANGEESNGYAAFFNRGKKVAIDMRGYSDGENVAEGGFSLGEYCSVQISNAGGTRYVTIIDKTGKKLFEPIPGIEIQPCSQERALYRETGDDKEYSYIDLTGEKVIGGIQEGTPFDSNGLARVLRSIDQGTDPATGEVTKRTCFIDVDGNVAF